MENKQFKYEMHKELCDNIHELYKKKNNDYGFAIEKGVNELGWIYLSSQLFNKYQRFLNLTKPDISRSIENETLTDTLLDMANYAIEGARILKMGKEV